MNINKSNTNLDNLSESKILYTSDDQFEKDNKYHFESINIFYSFIYLDQNNNTV